MKPKKYLLSMLAILLIVSCTEDLDVDYKGKATNKLVVDGTISTDTTSHRVVLSRTVERGTDVVYETGATVTISDSSNVYYLEEKEAGIYETDSTVFGETGKTYTLNIITAGNEEYTAVSSLNPISQIDSVKFQKEYFALAGLTFYKVYFFGQEPEEPGQYYLWNLYLNDSLVNDTIDETRFEEDTYVNGSYFQYFDIYWIEEKTVTHDTVHVKLEMLSISKEYFQYLFEVMSETTWRGSPWDPLPANVSTNISNGGAGFFKAIAKTQKSIVYIKSEEEEGD